MVSKYCQVIPGCRCVIAIGSRDCNLVRGDISAWCCSILCSKSQSTFSLSETAAVVQKIMEKRVDFVFCVLCLIVVGCQALTPSAIKKLNDPDPRMTRELELFGKRAFSFAKRNISYAKRNISEQCTAALTKLITSNDTQQLIMYADASGKVPSGVLEGDFLWIGSYSACKRIPSSHYCLANTLVTRVAAFQYRTFPARLGVCVPNVCSELDVAVGIEDILAIIGLEKNILISTKPNPKSVYCAKKSEYAAGSIICLIICGILCVLCLGGTILDLMGSDLLSMKTKEESMQVQQNGSALHHEESLLHNDDPIHNDRETLMNGTSSTDYVPKKKNIIIQIFKCFSIIANTKKIMDTKSAPGAINSINGMRVLSISWVVLGHTYFWFLITNVGNNLVTGLQITQRFSFIAIDNAFVSVDSFFFLSGLLVGYIGLKRMAKNDGKLPWFKFYFHRFWRLTPTYMFCILFYATLFPHVNEGPLWYTSQMPTTCNKKWWTNLLYINNFYPKSLSKECLGWSWYLANDMQFYVISPLFLYAMYKFKLPGMSISIGSFLVASFITTGAIIGYYHLPATQGLFFEQQDGNLAGKFSDWVYVKPYCRISPYLVGMVLGYIFFTDKTHSYVRKLQPFSRLIFLAIGWSIAFICSFSSLYGVYKTMKANPEPFTQTENVIYGMFMRFSWSLGLAWVIYVCHTGVGGLVDNILSAKFWMPLSRLTYGTYLVHPLVLTAFYGGLEHTIAYTDYLIVIYFLGCLMVSYGISFILAIALEFPAMQLEKF